MNRDDMHVAVDKLCDNLEVLKRKANAAIDEHSDEIDAVRTAADCAVDSARRAVCRGKGWLRENLIQAQIDVDGVEDKLKKASDDSDKTAAETFTATMEKYAANMIDIAREAADEAAEAVAKADKARKDFMDKFGK